MRKRPLPTTNRRVLVVDDTLLNCELLTKLLTHRGYKTVAVSDGPTALHMIRRENFDLVLLDLMMPGLDGFDVLKRLRQEFSNVELPVIMITAQTTSESIIRCLQNGANDYITRPFNMAVTLARIEAQLKVKAQAERQTGELHKINGEPRTTPRSIRNYCHACLSVHQGYTHVCRHCGLACPVEGWPNIKGSPWPYLGKILGGRYFLEQLCGQGSSGRVFRARDLDLGRDFAIKLTDFTQSTCPDARTHMMLEIEALIRLDSPHIITIYQILRPQNDVWAIVMDYCKGGSLQNLLIKEDHLSPRVALDIARQVALALHETHSVGILHRDIKPANIMIERLPTGKCFSRVLDFGLARLISRQEPESGVNGTPEYIAPERIMSDMPVDGRADIYALGATLYYMLVGRPPFAHNNITHVLMEHLHAPIPYLPRNIASEPIVDMLDQLLQKMMAKFPEDRFQSAESLLFTIEGIEAELNTWIA